MVRKPASLEVNNADEGSEQPMELHASTETM